MIHRILVIVALVFATDCLQGETQWWKGNLHTHSLWSDGDDFPEMIAEWYKSGGYHFLAITDHNTLHEGEKWIPITPARMRDVAHAKYLKRFGSDWVVSRQEGRNLSVRLKTLSEYREKIEQRDRFLLIQSEEISARHLTAPIHLNAANLLHRIEPRTGSNTVDVLQNNIDAILEQERATGRPVLPHVNHPNFRWAITAEELMQIRGGQFFEVYNGHPLVFNEGDATHAGTERVWDIINARRLTELDLPPMLGLATDDTHNYHETDSKKSNAGRGWVMVRSESLTADALINAMKRGDFYASSGVTLDQLEISPKGIQIGVKPDPGVEYTIEFVGTRKDFQRDHQPHYNSAGEKLRLTHRYSDDIGTVLQSSKGTGARYKFVGDELFVRARIISTKAQQNPIHDGDLETAWTQPVSPKP
ncbi:MAG: hypothetical protein ISQ14_08535 [Verrucomicrobiae bacterium]|nr:hypothetical protein [Verrucomicrobiae bacterium]